MDEEPSPRAEAAGEPLGLSATSVPFSEPAATASASSDACTIRFRTFGSRSAWPPPAASRCSRAHLAAPACRRPAILARGAYRRRPRSGPVIAIAAVTALLIGGGCRLRRRPLAEQRRRRRAATDRPRPVGANRRRRRPADPVPPTAARCQHRRSGQAGTAGTVMIQVGRGTGSGFVIDERGPHHDQQPRGRRGRRRRGSGWFSPTAAGSRPCWSAAARRTTSR